MDLQDNVTIADVVDKLNKPIEYVRAVVEHMHECRRAHGSASVRIGVTGRGRAPNYQIEYVDAETNGSIVFAIYYGLSHKQAEDLGEPVPIDILGIIGGKEPDPDAPKDPDRYLRSEHWSIRAMPLESVSAILGNLRARRR